MGRAFKIPEKSLDGTIFDENNPDALINIVPDRVKPVLIRMKAKMPRVLYCTEGELRETLNPDERDERVRLAFWDEYNHSTHIKKGMSLTAILHGVMSWEAWVTVYEKSDRKMMWVLCPPVSYQASMRQLIHKGAERLLEIMSLPIVDENGKVDHKTVLNILKCFQLVDLRVKGAITQKVQIQQQSYNVHASIQHPMPGDAQALQHLSLEELEKLEKRIARVRIPSGKVLEGLTQEQRREVLELEGAEERICGKQQIKKLDGMNLDSDIIIDAEDTDNEE